MRPGKEDRFQGESVRTAGHKRQERERAVFRDRDTAGKGGRQDRDAEVKRLHLN